MLEGLVGLVEVVCAVIVVDSVGFLVSFVFVISTLAGLLFIVLWYF